MGGISFFIAIAGDNNYDDDDNGDANCDYDDHS